MDTEQNHTDRINAIFWNELCGSNLASSLGGIANTKEGLQRFDDGYMTFYPYLNNYIHKQNLKDKNILEIGLGYGTLGQILIKQGCQYYGIDIAQKPIEMMKHRIEMSSASGNVARGSALELPFPDKSFDFIYSIGCLHHTGNIQKAVGEVYRVLKPGGETIIMLYNRHSLRQILYLILSKTLNLLKIASVVDINKGLRSMYDKNSSGDAAPHTDFVSKSDVRTIFKDFSEFVIDIRNFDSIRIPGLLTIQRTWLLNNIARIMGLDLYITAIK